MTPLYGLPGLAPQIIPADLRPQVAGLTGTDASLSIERFETALRRAEASAQGVPARAPQPAAGASDAGSFQVAQVEPSRSPGVPDAAQTYGQMDAKAVARGGRPAEPELHLGKTAAAADISGDSRGEAILDGLSRWRGAFDEQTAKLNDIAAHSANVSETLIQTQVEILKYSLLMDVSSKLTGKSTQAFDTLLKGQ